VSILSVIPRWSPKESSTVRAGPDIASAARPTPMSVQAVRTRPGDSARATMAITGRANSQPRLWASSDAPANRTAHEARTPRRAGGTSRRDASATAGQKAMNHSATPPFGYWIGHARRPPTKSGSTSEPPADAIFRSPKRATQPIAITIAPSRIGAPRRPSGQKANKTKITA
jgi:hypothetical protein